MMRLINILLGVGLIVATLTKAAPIAHPTLALSVGGAIVVYSVIRLVQERRRFKGE